MSAKNQRRIALVASALTVSVIGAGVLVANGSSAPDETMVALSVAATTSTESVEESRSEASLSRAASRRPIDTQTPGAMARQRVLDVDGNRKTWGSSELHTVAKRTESIDFERTTRKTDELFVGESRVVQAGDEGKRVATYRVALKGGKEVDRDLLKAVVKRKPVDQITEVGTKAKPEPKPVAANFAGGSTVWDRLAQCESGGNWAINTGNGYYGGLQFSPSTWRASGGSGLPHQASRAEQIRVATTLRDRTGGYGSWPGCAAKLGLPR